VERAAAAAAVATAAPPLAWEGPAATAAKERGRPAAPAKSVLLLGFLADHVQDAADDVADGEL
jgi:hypothetical protein